MAIMPRTEGVSSRVASRPMRFRPRPTRVARWSFLRRIGEPDEIAGAAVYLASKAGSFMTGQAMVVDGGATI